MKHSGYSGYSILKVLTSESVSVQFSGKNLEQFIISWQMEALVQFQQMLRDSSTIFKTKKQNQVYYITGWNFNAYNVLACLSKPRNFHWC